MSEVLSPADEGEVAALVAEAGASGKKLTIVGGGTRSGLGRPAPDEATVLSTRKLSGITLFEPSELVISAKAGTPLGTIEAALSGKRLMLPFEPMDHRALYGTAGEPTIGAIAACNISGPRRLSAGAARDHLIGVRLVNGRGEAVKSGGRVMKNVTGLDLVKLSAGAHGTLGVLTEVTFKLLPMPERTLTLVFGGLKSERAIAAMGVAMRLPLDVAAAAHLPPGFGGKGARTLFRVEGFSDSVGYRADRLAGDLALGTSERIDGAEQDELWRSIRDVSLLAAPQHDAVLRVHLPPSRSTPFVTEAERAGQPTIIDWAGGLVWLAVHEAEDIPRWRNLAQAQGGHATVVRADPQTRQREAVFQPLEEAVMRLTKGVKRAFDPHSIINFGRMYPGV